MTSAETAGRTLGLKLACAAGQSSLIDMGDKMDNTVQKSKIDERIEQCSCKVVNREE